MAKFVKAKDQQKFILIVVIIIVALIGALAYSNQGLLNGLFTAQNQSQSTKTFQSSNMMKFSIIVPIDYGVSENLSSVTVDAGEKGMILIGRSGTNFKSLNDYLNDLSTKNNSKVLNSESEKISGYQAYKQSLINEDLDESNRITHFIYVDGFVYSFSTHSEDLFDDLDQIAQSFKYAPD